MGNQKQQRQGIAKRTLSAKKVVFAIFFSGEAVQYRCQRKRAKRYWKLLQRYGIEDIEKEFLSETGPGHGFQTWRSPVVDISTEFFRSIVIVFRRRVVNIPKLFSSCHKT